MTTKKKATLVIKLFKEHNPSPTTELNFNTPFELLIAVILSARCTDKRVNMVTPNLFKKYPSSKTMSNASENEIHSYIKSVTFPNNKSKYLYKTASILTNRYNGKVPDSTEDLQKLPGVGRKTAHVIASVLHDQNKMVVDTHVNRVSKRIGIVSQQATTPLAVEKELINVLDKNEIKNAHHWLILHGRYICKARSPLCDKCFLTQYCDYYKKV